MLDLGFAPPASYGRLLAGVPLARRPTPRNDQKDDKLPRCTQMKNILVDPPTTRAC